MDLVNWNDALTDGIGRSGTRYKLTYERLADENAGGHWRIDVDDVTICCVATAQDALSHSEGLEALRCIIQGFGHQLSDDQLHGAGIIAAEMIEAAQEALTLPTHVGQRVDLSRNADALQALYDAIKQECTRRQGEHEFSALPLPN